MRFPSQRLEPGLPTHVLLQLLESGILDEGEQARFRAIMAREGGDPSTMAAPGAQAPMRWFREVCPDLDADKAALIGYHAGEKVRLTSNSLLSLPLVSAGSVSEALNLLKFLPLISNVISATFLESDEAVLIMLHVNSGDAVLDRLPVFYCAAAFIRLLRILSAEALELTFHIAWPMPAGLADHPDSIAGGLRFDAPMHYIAVPRRSLEAVCRFADPIAYRSAVASLQALLSSQATSDDVAARVRRGLEARPGLIRIDEVARGLNLSVSTLKRRLADAGTSFSDLLEEVLRNRAKLMLADATITLETIALTLGYSDLANFSHAFKRWTGTSPGVFRRLVAREGERHDN